MEMLILHNMKHSLELTAKAINDGLWKAKILESDILESNGGEGLKKK